MAARRLQLSNIFVTYNEHTSRHRRTAGKNYVTTNDSDHVSYLSFGEHKFYSISHPQPMLCQTDQWWEDGEWANFEVK